MPRYVTNNILIELLSLYKIKNIVLSSGARNIPFVSAIETDERFACYSVIDERNAAFYALGMSQQTREPAAIACTSGTAASNYLSGVTEAFYSHVPLVVITFDRSPYLLNQIETQKIDQPAIFRSVVKHSVSLPLIKDEDDIWYCQRLINEALIAMTRDCPGPVHINVPLIGDQNKLVSESVLRDTAAAIRRIDFIPADDEDKWREYAESLCGKKALIVMGQSLPPDEETKKAVRDFTALYKIPVLSDHLANFRCCETVFSEAVIKALNRKTAAKYVPDILISFGANFQERIKDIFRPYGAEIDHWSIDPEGLIKDTFKCERALFACRPETFFAKMVQYARPADYSADYLARWKRLEEAAVLPEMPFTSFYAVREFSKVIPRNSILHTAILNSTRLMQFFRLDESITCYSNVNAFGIDGCLPTFMGQAAVTDKPAFLVIGDLSFFYGMNAAAIKHRKNNIRILVLNNGGGAEFHIMPESDAIPTIDLHIGAAHSRSVKGWVESMDYRYLSASDEVSLQEALAEFVAPDQAQPVVLEVFTDMKTDGKFLLSVYRDLERSTAPVVEEQP